MRIARCLGECTAASRRSTSAVLRSVLTVEGTLEMDASVTAGETLAAGAVGVVSGVMNPVRLARAVLAESREVLLVGEAAAALSERHVLPCAAPSSSSAAASAPPGWRGMFAELEGRLGAPAGLVLIEPAGRIGIAHTTEAMAAAWRSEKTGRPLLVG